MKKLIAAFAFVGFFIYTNPALAEMTSTNYQIRWDSISQGGSDTATSTSYGLHDTVGDAAIGNSTSTSYQVDAGYRAGIFDEVLTFDVLLQNASVQKAVTARSGTVVSVTSTSDFSVGAYVLLVENLGASQVSALGKITSISSGVSVTVDAWSDNGTTPTIDGTNDYLFAMNGSSVSLGTLNATSVLTSVIGFEVTADLTNGYSVQMLADGGLTNSIATVTAVADGSVTAGAQEYGARSSDMSIANSTFDTQDTAMTTAFQDVATESSAKYYTRHFVTLKAAGETSLSSGNYTQSITLIASGNF